MSVRSKVVSAGVALVAMALTGMAAPADVPSTPELARDEIQRASVAYVAAVGGRALLLDVSEDPPALRLVPTRLAVHEAYGLAPGGGARLLYRPLERGVPSGELLVEDLETGELQRIEAPGVVLEARWSPIERDVLAFTYSSGGAYGLAVARLDGPVVTLDPQVVPDYLAWAADGSGLHYFVSQATALVARFAPADGRPAQEQPALWPHGFPRLDDEGLAFRALSPRGDHEVQGAHLLGEGPLSVRGLPDGELRQVGTGHVVDVLDSGVIVRGLSGSGGRLELLGWDGRRLALGESRASFSLPVSSAAVATPGECYAARTCRDGAGYAYEFGVVAGDVLAAAEGLVVYAGSSSSGDVVVLEHAWGSYTRYAGLKAGSVRVPVGQALCAGAPIAEPGLAALGFRHQAALGLESESSPVEFTSAPACSLGGGGSSLVGPVVTATDVAQFVADVTYPDHSVVNASAAFLKTWRFRNVGTNTWSNYRLAFVSGEQMAAPAWVSIPSVAPNATVDVSVNLVAAASPTCGARGHAGVWQIRNASGVALSGGTATVVVTVNPGSGAPIPNLASGSYVSVNPFRFDYGGQCTALAWGRANERLGLSDLPTGNAADWWTTTTYPTGATPAADSIAVWGGGAGHVAYVESVSGGNVVLNEANNSCFESGNWGGGYDGQPKTVATSDMGSRSGMGALLGYIYLSGSGGTDGSAYVGEGPPLDGTQVSANAAFTKRWTLRNSGSTTWSSASYRARRVSGSYGPATIGLSGSVAPGANTDVTGSFTAPGTPGTYRATYQMEGPSGQFGTTFWVEVVVTSGGGSFSGLSGTLGCTATFNFTATGLSGPYAVDLSTSPGMTTDVYLTFGSGSGSPVVVSNPTKWDKYTNGRTLYWRVWNNGRTVSSAIQALQVNCAGTGFTGLSSSLGCTASFNFSYSGPATSYIVDLSTTAGMTTDVYLSFGVGSASPVTVTNPKKWDKYTLNRPLYWRVWNSARTLSSGIQAATVTCP